jgi:hypothetical protein
MKIAQRIYDETLAHGGSTMDLLGNIPVTGFMVSELGGVQVPLTEFSVRDIEHVIAENKNALFGIGAYIGTWIDGETVHVDHSVNFTNLGIALSFGQKHGQKSIYSLNTKKVLTL